MFNDRLLRILDEEVAKERARKQAKIRGIVKDKKISKNNNIVLIIKKGKFEYAVLVNKSRKEMFDLAEKLKVNDEIYAKGDKGVNVVFCDKLELVRKADLSLNNFK
jgi:tRNA(Ile2) C34 agmatinyltransferase TiaS